jgi:methylated-DNA-[protein]-cysteine S-methyltransferase
MDIQRFQARMATPFAVMGISTDERFITGIEFLPLGTPILVPKKNSLAQLVCVQLNAYIENSGFKFDLPLKLTGTQHQIKVWEALCSIPHGKALTYGELAAKLKSAPRAVGQACGRNPLPVVVPCHRVVAAGGSLGGFMGGVGMEQLGIKRWLLRHEGCTPKRSQ